MTTLWSGNGLSWIAAARRCDRCLATVSMWTRDEMPKAWTRKSDNPPGWIRIGNEHFCKVCRYEALGLDRSAPCKAPDPDDDTEQRGFR